MRIATRHRLRVQLLEDGPTAYRATILLRPSVFRPPMHRHPGFEERMRVKAGRLTVRLEDGTLHLGPGDAVLVIETGRWHTVFNRSRTTVRFDVDVRPAGRFREFFEGLARWTAGVPNPIRVASLFWRHRHEVELRGPAKVLVRLLRLPR